MQKALSNAEFIADRSILAVLDTLGSSLRIMVLVPVEFPDNYMVQCYQSRGWCTLIMAQNLPSPLLCGFGARQLVPLCVYL